MELFGTIGFEELNFEGKAIQAFLKATQKSSLAANTLKNFKYYMMNGSIN